MCQRGLSLLCGEGQSDCRSCVCISGCVKHGIKSYCVKEGAADPGPVVTVPWSFVGGPSAVNLLHSPRTKGCLHLWVLGGGVCRWINNKGSGTSQTSLNSFSGRPGRWHRDFWGFLCYHGKSANPFWRKCEGIPSRVYYHDDIGQAGNLHERGQSYFVKIITTIFHEELRSGI